MLARMRWLWLAVALVASAALAGDPPNKVYKSFGVDATGAEQHFTIASKVGANVRQADCDAWLVENDSAAETVWIKWHEPVGMNPTLPVAVADLPDAVPNQMRLKPGQAKRLDAFSNTYLSIIATGAAHVHFEQHCGTQ